MLVPIATTFPNWRAFIELCQEALGESPTRGNDIAGIKISDPFSYLAALSCDNNPLVNLSEGAIRNNTHQHFWMSFGDIVNSESLIKILEVGRLRILIRQATTRKYRDCYLVILTGSIDEWVTACQIACHPTASIDLQELFSPVVKSLQSMGFAPLFQGKLLHVIP